MLILAGAGDKYVKDESFFQSVMRFTSTFPDCLILIELDRFTRLSTDDQAYIGDILAFRADGIRYVVSLSSGGGTFLPTSLKSFKNFVTYSILPSTTIQFLPFNEDEARALINDSSEINKYPLEFDFYLHLTNLNPSLLSVCYGCDQQLAIAEVSSLVKKCANEFEYSLRVNDFKWMQASLEISRRFLSHAYNKESIPKSLYGQYEKSYLSSENITYIVHEDKEFFRLAVNYPPVYDLLIDTFKGIMRHVKRMPECNKRVLQGHYFESLVCEKIKKFHLHYQNCKTNSFGDFEFQHYDKNKGKLPVKTLMKQVLYHLRPFHPVVDAVGYTEDSKGNKWLLLIQVSLSTYSDHKSKASNLLDPLKGPERDIHIQRGADPVNNWIDYYRGCIVNETERTEAKVMYIYISPEEFFSTDAAGKVCNTLALPAQMSQSKEFLWD